MAAVCFIVSDSVAHCGLGVQGLHCWQRSGRHPRWSGV